MAASLCVVVLVALTLVHAIDDLNHRTGFPPRFIAQSGWFVQGDLYDSKPADIGFQYPEFGAMKSWNEIHEHLRTHPTTTKLLLMIRHGEGVHNQVLSIVGQ